MFASDAAALAPGRLPAGSGRRDGSAMKPLSAAALTELEHLVTISLPSSRHFSPMGPEKAALFGIKRLTRTTSKPNGGGPYENRV